MTNREFLLAKFNNLPFLINATLAESPLIFPEIKGRIQATPWLGPAPLEVALHDDQPRPSGRGRAISDLSHAINEAASKPEFAKTSLEQWDRIMQFSGSKVRRSAREKRYKIMPSEIQRWEKPGRGEEGIPINVSQGCANDWFINTLLNRIKIGSIYKHNQAILGAQGCGKSTLIKYLISKNAEECRKKHIVFSRFEFVKYWKEWRNIGQSQDESLRAYMTFIHLRDLFLNHFFEFKDGNTFSLKFRFSISSKELEGELARLADEASQQSGSPRNMEDNREFLLFTKILRECLSKAKVSNHELMRYIRTLPVAQRLSMIGALWDQHCVVTIFDGMDSLQIEDAFQETEEWKAVKHIIRNRLSLSTPTHLRDEGRSLSNDSIVVLRQSTASILAMESSHQDAPLGLVYFYKVDPLDPMSAMVSIIMRALEGLKTSDLIESSMLEPLTFDLMKIVQRTMLAIGRNGGGKASLKEIYNIFDGNLRDLFRFVASTISWTCQEMLRSKFLETDEIFGSVEGLITTLASERGRDFLVYKSYRVIEQLLIKDGSLFENAAIVTKTTKSPLLKGIDAGGRVRSNPTYFGFVDNIFSYLFPNESRDVDRHNFLEKIRTVQLLGDKACTDGALVEQIRQNFGYAIDDEMLLFKLLLKTGFISAEVVLNSSEHEIHLQSTSKAKLCIKSLIGNLAYLEHVFHQTLFPSVLVSHISDLKRESGTIEWVASSIRNAFIFLTYFRHIEQNNANGVSVPSRYRLFESVKIRVMASLDRITKAAEKSQESSRRESYPDRDARARQDATAICKRALDEVDHTLKAWQREGLIVAAPKKN